MGTTGLSITLANSIIGVGILAMPFCFQQCGVLLATLILLFMGLISRLCCYFLLKSAVLARRRNFEFLAFHVFGSGGKMAVEVGIIGFLMGTCIAYFVVVGDLGPQIISKMFSINQSNILRTSIMVIVSVVCVLPLGLLRNVDSLSNVSAATIGFYFCLVIKVIAEAASQLPSGAWQRRVELWRPQGLLQCVPIFSMALFCQTQLFEIFESLPSLSLEKMNLVTKNAINICTAVYFTLGIFGYIAFSEKEISGNILMSLSPTLASDVIKLGFVMSLAFSFPLIIFPCRASLYSFLYKKVHSSQHDHIVTHSIPERPFRALTGGIVVAALVVAVLLPSIELVLGLLGATVGVLVCLVFPAAAFLHLTARDTAERQLAKCVVVLGLFIMVLGTFANLQAAESQIERYDERFITQEKIDKIVEDFFQKRGRDDINLKPVPNDPVAIDPNKINGNIIKDSEVQPPNPVPPESNSIELKNPETKVEKLHIDKILNEKSINDVLLPEKLKEEAADTISDSHPKNIKSKLDEAKIANSDTNNNIEEKPKPPPAVEENKVEKIKLIKQQQLIETMKQHGEEQKELMQEQKEILDEIIKTKKEMNVEKPKEPEVKLEEPKIDANKHQQLIETIKQHGEEQKELMKEQKEILDEIKELKQNKDTDSLEAKKLAVESIKQIADMAIKSIGGVTEKPDGQPEEVKKADRLEKLTNEAVQEIAKKAVETIEAIQEIKEKPEAAKPVVNHKEENNMPQINNKVENKMPQLELPLIPNIETKQDAPALNSLDINQNDINHKQANVKRDLLSNKEPESQAKQEIETPEINKINNEAIEKEIKQDINKEKVVAPVTVAKNENEVERQNTNKLEKDVSNDIEVKPHSHSPDEPQSYKLGEDSQIKNVQNEANQLNVKVPLAVAMSDKAKIDNVRTKLNEMIENNVKDSKVDIPNVDNLVRQKRDVVDCSRTVSLEPADRSLCKALNLLPLEHSLDILPKVDLNDRLSKMSFQLPVIGRSLKSYDERRKR